MNQHPETRETDVILIGVGTCGEDLALRLLGEGLDVVGIEAALVGGECPYWACLPSKMMIRAAHTLQEARRVNQLAGQATVAPDWAPVAARVRADATGDWDDSVATQRFHDRGGLLIHGHGRLTGPNSVTVGDQEFTARRGIVIATGSQPVIPPVPGLEATPYWTTHDVIALKQLPQSLLVIGGGAVGCELSQLLARFGVDVTVIEAGERLLPGEEPEASAAVATAFDAEGITVHTGLTARQVAHDESGFHVTLDDDRTINGEQLLVATGRRVNLSDLGLETIGLDPTARFLAVDDRMRVSERIYAMGDVTGKAMFTHMAMYQGAIVAADILGEPYQPARYDAVPRVTFTDPEVGAVGLTEAQAVKAGYKVTVAVKQLPFTFRQWLHASDNGVLKLVVDQERDVLIGATAVGPHGGEMIGLLTLAVRQQLPLDDLRGMIYAFPTFYGAIGEALGAYGVGLRSIFDPEYMGFEPV